jgi:hypothetical protein
MDETLTEEPEDEVGTPAEAVEYEDVIQVAVEGEVVARLQLKPEATISPMEDELVSQVLTETFSTQAEPNEDAREAITKYDPEVRIYTPEEDGGEGGWSQPMPASELNLDLPE